MRAVFFFFKKFSQQEENFKRQKAAVLDVRPSDLVRILCLEASISFRLIIQSNLSTTATLETEEIGRCRELAVMGR